MTLGKSWRRSSPRLNQLSGILVAFFSYFTRKGLPFLILIDLKGYCHLKVFKSINSSGPVFILTKQLSKGCSTNIICSTQVNIPVSTILFRPMVKTQIINEK